MRVVYWTCDKKKKKEIMEYFGMEGTTKNGETYANNIPADKEEYFIKGSRKGYYQIRNK